MIDRIKYLVNTFMYKVKIIYARRNRKKYNKYSTIDEVTTYLKSRNEQYNFFYNYFWNKSPLWLKEHRAYFTQKNRGFGEDAFHAMWHIIFSEYKPKKILEIGVYRGQTISLFRLLSNKLNVESEIHGISPFTSSGDEVSKYINNLNYQFDVIENFNYFNLKQPILHKGFSNETNMIQIINSESWDLVYIDGNHDYEVAKLDFENSSNALKINGLLILDDSSLFTDYKPKFYSTIGHPGPSKVAEEIDPNKFKEILSVGHNRVFQKIS